MKLRRLSLCLLPLLLIGAAPQRPRPHLILISVDTLRADHLGAYGYAGRTSPFLDALAERGLLFENVYVPLPQTGPSHASLFTSVPPPQHGVLANGMIINPRVDTLAAALKRAGYRTAGVVAVGHIGREHGYARGFDTFTEPRIGTPADDIRGDADSVNADARRFIAGHVAARGGRPLFLFLHYFDCHYPYRWWDKAEKAPDPWTAEVQLQREMQIRRYDDGVAHVDAHLREIYDYARAKLGSNVVFAVTSDHGEQIGDHGVAVGHADIYRETTAVPLIIEGPGLGKARVSAPVSGLDIGVALARLGGAKFANRVDGRDLLETAARTTSLAGRVFGDGEKTRPFVVSGSPGYTRSVALIEGTSWFIRNFDHFYRNAWVETPAPDALAGAKPIAGTTAGDETSYAVPFARYQPTFVAVEHVAKDADCAMTAVATIAPDVRYYAEPIAFRKSIRLTLPAARLDRVSLTVAPAKCAGKTTYSVVRVDDIRTPASAYRTPTLYAQIYGIRKRQAKDELFDVRDDPRMLNNIVDSGNTGTMAEKLRALWESIAALPPPASKISPEERRRLRSLGYLN